MNEFAEQKRSEWSILGWLQLSFAAGCFATAAWAHWRSTTVGDDVHLEIGLMLIAGTLISCLSGVAFIVERAHRRQPKAAEIREETIVPVASQHAAT